MPHVDVQHEAGREAVAHIQSTTTVHIKRDGIASEGTKSALREPRRC
jgi:hypothetical protein